MKRILSCSLLLIVLLHLNVSGQHLQKGRITDTVKCQNHPDQSYALYLPSNYIEIRKWPVILIFDPAARGPLAVEVFRKAAEKYGYIIACSNNSRNGPLANNFKAADYMLNDLLRRIVADNKRIYSSGFSGGSRFALALASSNTFIAGVIGCGAGLPNDKNLFPGQNSAFVYYGIVGNRDMNYLEMFDLLSYFNNNTRIIPYLRTFEGGHKWPSQEIALEAVEWLNLLAIRRKLIPEDSAFASYYLNKVSTNVHNLVLAGNQFDAARYLRFTIRDFSGEKAERELTISLSAIEQTKEYREGIRDWNSIAARERKMNETYMAVLNQIISSGTVSDSAAAWWKREVINLNSTKAKSKPQSSQMASRKLNYISILFSEQGMSYYRQKEYNMSDFFFEICTFSDNENPNNYYNLARSYSSSKKNRSAIEALNKAVDHGFISAEKVNSESAFDNIRNDEKFKALQLRLK